MHNKTNASVLAEDGAAALILILTQSISCPAVFKVVVVLLVSVLFCGVSIMCCCQHHASTQALVIKHAFISHIYPSLIYLKWPVMCKCDSSHMRTILFIFH